MKNIKKTGTILFFVIALLALSSQSVEAKGKVKISPTKKTISVGQTTTIKLKNSSKKVKWSTSNKKIKIVSKSKKQAKIKGVSKGTSYLKARVGKKTYKCKILIDNPKLSKTNIIMTKGNYEDIGITGTKRYYEWGSENKSVADVSYGRIYGKNVGVTNVYAKVDKIKLKCKVTIEEPKISNEELEMILGENAKRLSLNGTQRNINWTSSNEKVAIIDKNGNVNSVGCGECKIKADIGDGEEYECNVTVRKSDYAIGGRLNPISGYKEYITDVYDYRYLGRFKIQLLDYKDGDEAWEYIRKNNEYADFPTNSQEWIYLKFKLNYINGNGQISAENIVNRFSNIFNFNSNHMVENISWAYNFEDSEDIGDIYLYPGGSSVFSTAILVKSGNTPITYRIQTGETNEYNDGYTWFTTKK